MTTLKKVPFQLVEIEALPKVLEEGKFYYLEEYKGSKHLCACGCGTEIFIPIKEGEWQITNKEKLTVTPSLHHRMNCEAHYIFQDGFANIVNNPISKNENGTFGFQYDTHAPGSCPL